MKRKFAISDIHGCVKTLEALLDKIAFSKNDELYLLGDYIDRGPDSKGVLDAIFKLQQDGYKVQGLRGNHEQMLLDELDQRAVTGWIRHGGLQTLNSFNAIDLIDIPEKYIRFLRKMPYFFEVDEYLLTHAGLNFRMPDPMTDVVSMLWIRNWSTDIDYKWLGDRIVVHGHTPVPKIAIQHHLENLDKIQTIDIDNGCCFGRDDMNRLCAFDLTNREVVFQRNVELV